MLINRFKHSGYDDCGSINRGGDNGSADFGGPEGQDCIYIDIQRG